jgi:HD superfamily phosphohydrolase YqeK
MRATYFSVRPFAWHAVAATLAVIVLPLILVLGLVALDVELPMLVIALLGIGLSIAATAVGHTLWTKRVEAAEISFSDLMLWRWFIRRRAEDTLEEGARLLGLDRSGHPIDEVRITPDQQLEVLKDLTAALESKDPYTHGHSQRVERHAYRTAAAMHLSVHDIDDLRKAAALHDVGKIRVPDRILRKPEQLTIEERVIMEEHAVVGAWMVSSVGNADVIAAVRHHHERYDGLGYPDGLAGAEIPLFSRIIGVADAYDAMTSTRPYRTSAGRDDAVNALRAEAGKQFDPEVVEAFIAALPARLPITAGLFLIMGGAPQRLLRGLASWLKRLGAGSLSPAVGAAGAAVVLGASVFTPNVPSAVAPPPAVAAPADPVEESNDPADIDPLPRNERERDPRPDPRPSGDFVEGRVPGDGSIVLSDTLTRDEPTVEEPLVQPAEPQQSPSPEDPAPTPSEEPAEEPNEEPEPAPEPSEDSQSKNRNDGRDGCGSDGNAGSGNDPARCGGGESGGTSGDDGGAGRSPGAENGNEPEKPVKVKDKVKDIPPGLEGGLPGKAKAKGKSKPKG